VIPLLLEEVSALCPGRLEAAPWADRVTGVKIDSRRIDEGDLFVAVGSGAEFGKHAVARGAAATLVPDEPFAAMAALGRAVREQSSARVVGITGSTGKTSTKDILAGLCGPHRRTVAAEASYNAELGVPLTLCRLEEETELCILELAMRGFGQIAELCRIARPELGLITNIAPVHLEFVGSTEGVARAKAELLDALPAGGTAVVPTGAPELEPFLTRADLTLVRFGEGGDVRLTGFELEDGHARLGFATGSEGVELELPITARYQAQNALAAVAVYRALGLPLDELGLGAVDVAFSRWRGEERPLPGGGLLINDCYNANPVSLRAALDHLDERAGARRKVAVLGEMAELGPGAPEYHREVGAHAAAVGVAVLVAVGAGSRAYLLDVGGRIPEARWVPSAATAVEAVTALLQPGDCVLLKGSRSVGLELVADALTLVAA